MIAISAIVSALGVGAPQPDRVLTLDEMVAGSVTFPVPDASQKHVFVVPKVSNGGGMCVLPVVSGHATISNHVENRVCLEVLKTDPGDGWILHHGDPYNSSAPLEVPKAESVGLKLVWWRKEAAAPGTGVTTESLIAPQWPDWAGTTFEFSAKLGDQWISGTLMKTSTGTVQVIPEALIASLKSESTTLSIFGRISGKLVEVSLNRENIAPDKSVETKPTGPGELAEACGSPEIRRQAREAKGALIAEKSKSKPGGPDDPKGGEREEAPPDNLSYRKRLLGDWFYITCYDLTDPNSPKTVTITEPQSIANDILKGKEVFISPPRDTLLAGHDIVVVVWGKPGTKADVSLSGDPDWGTSLYIPRELDIDEIADAELAPNSPVRFPHTVKRFAPRGGEHVTVTVRGKIDIGEEKKEEKADYEYKHVRRVEELYRGALRVGLAFSWAPWERTFKASEGLGGTRYIDFETGSPNGLLDIELAFGYTAFFSPLPSLFKGVRGGWYAGGGLIKAGENGISILNSVHTGPELTIGRGVGIALTASIRRTKWLAADSKVGAPLLSGEPPTRFGVTPVFSIIINLQPAIFQAIGKIAPKRYGLFGGGS